MRKAAQYEDLQRVELTRAMGDVLRWRLGAAPLGLLVTVGIVAAEPRSWRSLVVAFSFFGMAGLSIVYASRATREPNESDVAKNLTMMTLAQLGVVVATGALTSPIFPTLYILTLLMVIVLRPRTALTTVGVQGFAILLMGALELAGLPLGVPVFLGGGGPAPTRLLTLLRMALAGFILVGVTVMGRRVRKAIADAGTRAASAQSELLASLGAETRALTTMAGEIAHELKNPLATVKGLAQRIAKDLDGKGAERAGVMRRELDRMQGILEEFLNFSRPLVPLTLTETDLRGLGADVARLCEGVAEARGVKVELEAGSDVAVTCDERKIKQVLVNLFQNAIAASPQGGRVRLSIEARGADVELALTDEGRGLSPDVAEHVFEAGFTTKSGGSGLGLTVSRALCRQHGGDLSLESSGRGCVARIVLPKVAVPAEAS